MKKFWIAVVLVLALLPVGSLRALARQPEHPYGFPGEGSISVWRKADSYNAQASKLYNQKKYKEALALLDKARTIYPYSAMIYYNSAQTNCALGNRTVGIQQYKNAIELFPNYALAWSGLAIAYEKIGKIKEAKLAYLKALQVDPDHCDAAYNLADLLEKNSDPEGAVRYFEYSMNISKRLGKQADVQDCCKRIDALKKKYPGLKNSIHTGAT